MLFTIQYVNGRRERRAKVKNVTIKTLKLFYVFLQLLKKAAIAAFLSAQLLIRKALDTYLLHTRD